MEPIAHAPKPMMDTLMAEIEKLVDEEDEDADDDPEATALSSFNSPLLLCTSISQDTPAKPSLQKHAPSLHSPRLLQSW